MWWHFVLLLTTVEVDHLHGVQWQASERIDCDAKEAGVRVDVPVDVSFSQVVVNGGVIQKSQVSHVVGHFILWRVHLQQLVSLEFDLFVLPGHQSDIVPGLGSDLGDLVALLFARHKKVLGGAVWHRGQLNLSLLRHQKELERLNYFGIIHINHLEICWFGGFSFYSSLLSIKYITKYIYVLSQFQK